MMSLPINVASRARSKGYLIVPNKISKTSSGSGVAAKIIIRIKAYHLCTNFSSNLMFFVKIFLSIASFLTPLPIIQAVNSPMEAPSPADIPTIQKLTGSNNITVMTAIK